MVLSALCMMVVWAETLPVWRATGDGEHHREFDFDLTPIGKMFQCIRSSWI